MKILPAFLIDTIGSIILFSFVFFTAPDTILNSTKGRKKIVTNSLDAEVGLKL